VDIDFDFEKRYRLAREVIETVVLTVLMFLVIRLAVQNFNVDGMSMEPNLHNGELILVDRWSYFFRAPARGDIIVFVAPPQPDTDYVKRIIGLPGDVVTVHGTTVIVNGKTLDDAFVQPSREGNPFPSFTNLIVPPNTYFVLGDNRAGSSDSRAWGCVPRQNLIGRAALVYWPLGQDNDGLIPNESIHFTGIPQPPATDSKLICHISSGNGNDFARAAPQPGAEPLGGANMALVLLMPGTFVACSRLRKKSAR
jgi:signal peptidase I